MLGHYIAQIIKWRGGGNAQQLEHVGSKSTTCQSACMFSIELKWECESDYATRKHQRIAGMKHMTSHDYTKIKDLDFHDNGALCTVLQAYKHLPRDNNYNKRLSWRFKLHFQLF